MFAAERLPHPNGIRSWRVTRCRGPVRTGRRVGSFGLHRLFLRCDLLAHCLLRRSSARSGLRRARLGCVVHRRALCARPPTNRALHRRAWHVHPPQTRDRLAADQSSLVEQPRVRAVEFLERVVTDDDGLRSMGDLKNECVASADHARRRRDDLACVDRGASGLAFALRNAMLEGRIDDDGDEFEVILIAKRRNGFTELL